MPKLVSIELACKALRKSFGVQISLNTELNLIVSVVRVVLRAIILFSSPAVTLSRLMLSRKVSFVRLLFDCRAAKGFCTPYTETLLRAKSKTSNLLPLVSEVATASTTGRGREHSSSFSTFKVWLLLSVVSIAAGNASASPSSKHLLQDRTSFSKLVFSFSVVNRFMAASGPRELKVKSKHLSVLRTRMAVIEGSSVLLMWHSYSDNVSIVHGLVAKELRMALTPSSTPCSVRSVREVLTCSALERLPATVVVILQFFR